MSTTFTFFMGTDNATVEVEAYGELDRAVATVMVEHAQSYQDDGLAGFMADLNHGGCSSGLVGEMIYHRDTLAFYETHTRAIGTLLLEVMNDLGAKQLDQVFGEQWDAEDPLALDTSNRNLLAWFAFEETAKRLARDAGIDD